MYVFVVRLAAVAALATLLVPRPATGREDTPGQTGPTSPATTEAPRPSDPVRRWNAVLLAANALDHTPALVDETRVHGEQIGPGRTARAFAIVHIAMFDALVAVRGGYTGFTGLPPAPSGTSWEAAVAQAAHDTLAVLYPAQAARFAEALDKDLAAIADPVAAGLGRWIGMRAAGAILAARASDGSAHREPVLGQDYVPGPGPGEWRPDPVNPAILAVGAHWGQVQPFVLSAADQFGVVPPPALTSEAYAAAFAEVRRYGGDGVITPTKRSPDQTAAGLFWAYDGTPGLGTPPRLYNQIVVHIANQQKTGPVALARLLALVNIAMADVGIACWQEKYQHRLWRPVTGIREADPGTGPTGLGDGNPATVGDPTFTPLGAPLSNAIGPNFTPPFPAYASGHAAFGGAVFQVLRLFYRTDEIPFTFVSDELNGVTTDNTGRVRPKLPRSFKTLSAAEQENGQSRIYLGIHWRFDKTRGISAGRQVATYVFRSVLRPR